MSYDSPHPSAPVTYRLPRWLLVMLWASFFLIVLGLVTFPVRLPLGASLIITGMAIKTSALILATLHYFQPIHPPAPQPGGTA